MLETPAVTGIFNVGTGKARSFKDLIGAMYAALGRAPNIEYIDMPAAIRDTYQYFTQAEVANLQRAGYNAGFAPLEEACAATSRSSSIAKTGTVEHAGFREAPRRASASRPSSASAI